MDFYYDESYQCPALNFDGKDVNVSHQSNPEFYIGCFIGSDDWKTITPQLFALEQKYKAENGFTTDGELKSNNLVKSRDVKDGFSSLSSRTVKFYQTLFDIINNHVVIHLVVFNKYEEIFRNTFPNITWFEQRHYDYRSFIYGWTKFFKHHQSYDILSILYSYKNTKWKVKQLTEIFENHLNKIYSLDKKKEEIQVIQEWIYIINEHDFYFIVIKPKIPWDYNKIAISFKVFCKSQGITPNEIGIDNHQQTVECMQILFPQTKAIDSINSIQVRVCDWVVGLIGRFILAYDSMMTSKFNQSIEFENTLSLLPDKSFILNEEQNALVLSMYSIFLEQQEGYWSTTTSLYADMVGIFYEFIRYAYRCDFNKTKMNAEDFNKDLVLELHHQFNNLKGE